MNRLHVPFLQGTRRIDNDINAGKSVLPFRSVGGPTISRVMWCVLGAGGWRDTNTHSGPSADSLAWIADRTSPVPPTRRMRIDWSFDRRRLSQTADRTIKGADG
jgi:hypothetical protein